MNHHVIVDGNSIAHWRFWGSVQIEENGRQVGMLRSVEKWLGETLNRLETNTVTVCFDSPKNWRYEHLPTYKGQRSEKLPSLVEQLNALPSELDRAGFPTWTVDGYEADDLCAAAVERTDGRCTIVSLDKDLCQLVDDDRGTRVFSPRVDQMYDEAGVIEKFGVPAYRLREWLALAGDAADNVKGVPGWGEKTAEMAINASLDLRHLLDLSLQLQLPVRERLQRTLNTWHEQLKINLEVVGLRAPKENT